MNLKEERGSRGKKVEGKSKDKKKTKSLGVGLTKLKKRSVGCTAVLYYPTTGWYAQHARTVMVMNSTYGTYSTST